MPGASRLATRTWECRSRRSWSSARSSSPLRRPPSSTGLGNRSSCRVGHPLPIRRPDWHLATTGFRDEPGRCRAFEVKNPDVKSRSVDVYGTCRPSGEAGKHIGARRCGEEFSPSGSVHPDEPTFALLRGSRQLGQQAGIGNGVLCAVAHTAAKLAADCCQPMPLALPPAELAQVARVTDAILAGT